MTDQPSDHSGTHNAPFDSINKNPEPDGTVAPTGLQSIGPYQLIRELGRGAMGAVFEAEHDRLKRRVAVKILPEELASSADAYARFQREMEAIGQLEHPNIVLATDAGQVNGICYIAMQLVSGVDLGKVLSRKGRLPIGVACEVIRQVALGLQEISERNIVHRDIKPSNLFLTDNGTVKILDLGIASLRKDPATGGSQSGKLTMTDSFLGTPDYVAPEQIVTQGPIDTRADIYSLGCTLYHLLGGKAPFSGASYMSFPAKLMGHMEHAPEPLRLESELPREISAVIEKMMAKNREDRYRRPRQVADALEPFCDPEALQSLAGVAEPTPKRKTPKRVKSKSKSRPIVVSIAVTSVLLVGLFLVAPLINPPKQQAENDIDQDSGLIAENQNTTETEQTEPPPSTTSVENVQPEEEQADSRAAATTPRDEETTNQEDNQIERLMVDADEVDSQSITKLPSENESTDRAEKVSEDSKPNTAELVNNTTDSNIVESTTEATSNAPKEMPTDDVAENSKEHNNEPLKDIAKSVAVIAESSQSSAKSQEKIALTLEQMQKRFDDFSEQVNDDPQSPVEWYANAIIHAKSGNQLEARRAYLSFFASNLNVVDPYASFARLLRLQEGAAGAKETFGEIPGDRTIAARQLAHVSLQPREEQRPMLEKLVKENPEFGPAQFELGKSIAGSDINTLSLLDQMAAKTALENYLQAHEQGKVLKYYLDQSLVAETLKDAQSLLNRVRKVDQELVDNPVAVNGKIVVLGEWQLFLIFAEGVRDPSYRLHPDDAFEAFKTPARPSPAQIRAQVPNFRVPDTVDLTLIRNATLKFRDDRKDLAIEVKYVDRNQVPRGPFKLNFSPKAAEIEQSLEFLRKEGAHENWVDLEWREGQIWFTDLLQLNYKAITEVRYGINVEVPNKIFPIPTADYGKGTIEQYWAKVNVPVRFVTLQVTTIDGKKTPIYRYLKGE